MFYKKCDTVKTKEPKKQWLPIILKLLNNSINLRPDNEHIIF